MNGHYVTTHNHWDPNLVLPLPVHAFDGESVYVDPIWGIKIDSVTEDDKSIAAEDYDIDLDDVNFDKIKIGALPLIYRVRFNSFFFARSFDEDDYKLERFSLHQTAKHIRISYNVRASGAVIGPLFTLDSFLV